MTAMPLTSPDNPEDPIAAALKIYEKITAYQVTLRSKVDDLSEEMRYYYKSGRVRMEFIKPHNGAVLTYNPLKKEARLKPLGLIHHAVTLGPESGLIRSSGGHKINESDIGSLLRVVVKLQSNGKTDRVREEDIAGRPAVLVRVRGNKDYTVYGIHRYDLWLDKEMHLPLKVVSYDLIGELIEEVLMDDLEINLDLPDDLFDL
jgi:hypothetical protein